MKKILTQLLKKAIPLPVPQSWRHPGYDGDAKALSLLLGDTLVDIRNYYASESHNGWLDCSSTYMTLARNGVVSFPISGDDVFYNVPVDTKAQTLSDMFRERILGQKIQNIYYYYNEDGEAEDGHLSFIELENGYVMTENIDGMDQTGNINLFLYTREEFRELVKKSPYEILPWSDTRH